MTDTSAATATPASTGPLPVIATLLLQRSVAPDVAGLLEDVGGTLGLTAVENTMPDVPIVLTGAGGPVFGRLVDGALPADPYRPLAAASWWWPEAGAAFDRHQAHMMVACAWTASSRVEAHARHTLLVRALLDRLPVEAVLWGSVVVSPDQYRNMFREMIADKRLPVPLWVRIDLGRTEAGATVATTSGLSAFGLMEVEAAACPMDPGRTYDFVRSFAQYLLTAGPVVADGHKVGETEAEQATVRHAASFRDAAARVYALEF